MRTNRRVFLGMVATGLWGCGPSGRRPEEPGAAPEPATGRDARKIEAWDPLGELEASVGGRLGVYAIDTESGREVAHRADERFAMCSTFKWALVAAVLARVDRSELGLDDAVTFRESDLLEYAPVAREHLADGRMTIDALAEAAVSLSDNTAANLLLARIGGPAELTRFLREHGDSVTRLDRDEPTLNTNLPDDPRDTTSPRAMVGSLRTLLLGSVLSDASRTRLLRWLEGCRTCDARLRAGLPAGWRAADKTGTGEHGAVNDVGILWPPTGAPIVIAVYTSGSDAPVDALSAVHAAVATLVAQLLGPS